MIAKERKIEKEEVAEGEISENEGAEKSAPKSDQSERLEDIEKQIQEPFNSEISPSEEASDPREISKAQNWEELLTPEQKEKTKIFMQNMWDTHKQSAFPEEDARSIEAITETLAKIVGKNEKLVKNGVTNFERITALSFAHDSTPDDMKNFPLAKAINAQLLHFGGVIRADTKPSFFKDVPQGEIIKQR